MKCDYFDLNSIFEHVEFYMPLYSIIQKSKTAKLLFMTPDQYIYNIAREFGNISYDDAVSGTFIQKGKVDKYAQLMLKGEKFPVPYFTRGKKLQEGRHRALAAKKIGCEEIPVIEFIPLSFGDCKKIALKLKNRSFDDLNKLFKKMGFKNGITEKGFDDLNSFIKYELDESNNLQHKNAFKHSLKKTIREIVEKIVN